MLHVVMAVLNCRAASWLVRSMSPAIDINEASVAALPWPKPIESEMDCLRRLVSCVLILKKDLISHDLCERSYGEVRNSSLLSCILFSFSSTSVLLSAEGLIEHLVFEAYELSPVETNTVVDETGTPAGWFPLIEGYDALPPLPDGLPEIPREVIEFLGRHERCNLDPDALSLLQNRLRSLFEAGPGAREDVEETDADSQNDDDESDQVVVGARIPIPAETFLEELSQKLEVHPISVYWLLKAGIEKDGWRCRPEEQRLTRDGFTVTILRLLGHRWPRQVEAGEPVPDWADDNGIIPLSEGTEEATLYQRLRDRLAAESGDQQVSARENAFAEIMGKSLSEWVRKDFFRHHVSRFKKRPIAWHLSSNGGSRQSPAFECLVYYHRTDGDLLPKIRSQFVGPLIKRLARELHGLETGGALNADQKARKDVLKIQIPELKAFDKKLSDVISSGFGPGDVAQALKQYAINDAVYCLKALCLRRLRGVIQAGPISDWQRRAEETGLHTNFSTWITEAFDHLDHFCASAGPRPPEASRFDEDPTAKKLAEWICAQAEAMFKDALKLACNAWWKSFNAEVLAPVAQRIKDTKSQIQALNDQLGGANPDFTEQSDIQRKTTELKETIKQWRKELTAKTSQGQKLRELIESWSCPEALEWEPWLAEQPMFDQLSSLDARRPPPQSIQDFVRQESLYQPDINDGVRVNVAPLQAAGLLTADVLAGKDVAKAIADRAAWRDDERRWCREGRLPQPGWWA